MYQPMDKVPVITFNGFVKDKFFCYRLVDSGFSGLEYVQVQEIIANWLFENVDDFNMGNDFPYEDYPDVKLYNANYREYFVILKNEKDVELFEDSFDISGISLKKLLAI